MTIWRGVPGTGGVSFPPGYHAGFQAGRRAGMTDGLVYGAVGGAFVTILAFVLEMAIRGWA